jgi:ubiquinone/menaquinone biosynthesis C-methylase UbiE
MHILHVGCGWGEMAIEISKIARVKGGVVRVGYVEEFIKVGRSEFDNMGLKNIVLQQGDAEKSLAKNQFNHAVARFRTMFFANSIAALLNLSMVLKPGALFAYIFWANK